MAVDIKKYKAAGEFDANAATDKRIVAVVGPVEGEDAVIGAGIVKKVAGGYSMTVETKQGTETIQKEYVFNASGYPANEETSQAGVRLTMAETNQNPVTSNVSESNIVYTRGSTEEGKTEYDESPEKNAIVIESLNAKDQFAIQILRSILDKVNNPSDLSKNEMAYYSEVAYTWAGYMMKESSEARSVIKNSTPSDSTKTEEVVYLEGNTEKLLNNIAAALDKTNAKITVGQEVDLIAERITIPELNKLIEDLKTLQENYVKDGNNTVGLKDLIAAINTTLTSLKNITSIGSINSLPDIEGNINSSVSGTISATLSRGSSASSPLYISSNMSNLNFQAIADNRIKLFAAALKESNSSLVIPDAWKS